MSNFKKTKRFIEDSVELLELFKRSSSQASSSSSSSSSAESSSDSLDSSDQPASAAPGKATFNKKYAKCLEDLKSQGVETSDIINSKSFTFPIKGLCFNAGYDVGTMGRKGKKGIVKARKSVSGKRTELVHAQAGIQNNDWTPKHKGIDIFCLNGQSKLVACVTGVITKIGKNSGRGGNTITVTRGPPGNAENFYYAHLSGHAQGFSEKKDIGKRVSIGTVIGYCGKTGSAQGTFPHLHFSYYVGGTYGNSNTDPWPYLGPALRGRSQRVGKSRKIGSYAKISPEEAQKAVAACPPPGRGLGESRGSQYGLVTEDFIMFNRTHMSPKRQNEVFKRAAKAIKKFFTGGDDKKDDAKSSGEGGVADRAEAEFQKWDQGETDEADPKMKDTLSAYWKNAEAPDYGTKQPWSAAFITYVVEPPAKVDKSGGKVKVVRNDTDFEGDAAHMKYMKAAKKARDDGKKSGYVAYQPSETEPNRGDIVCRPRGTGDGWNKIGTKNHCDIYVGNNQMIGGNLGNTSKKVPYNKKKASMIIKKLAEDIEFEEMLKNTIIKLI